MRVVSFNVNSIRAREHQIEAIVARHDPDLLGLQETKVDNETFPTDLPERLGLEASIHGQKGYHGVALFSRGAPENVTLGLPTDEVGADCRFIAAHFATLSGPLHVINAYFPQGESRDHPVKFPEKERFYAGVRAYLERELDPAEDVIVMGDMNVAPVEADIGIGEDNRRRWLRSGKCCFLSEEREWLAGLTDWGLVDSFRHAQPEVEDCYSWFDYRSRGFERTPRRGLRIDLILVSQSLAKRLAGAGIDYETRSMTRPSDHCPAWAHFKPE